MHKLARLDHAYVWHPFTQMRDWLKREPILIVRGKGAVLEDSGGRKYLDANSSIWTNLHGHNHPVINRAIRKQLDKIAHSSALGFANEPASLLAAELVKLGNESLLASARRPAARKGKSSIEFRVSPDRRSALQSPMPHSALRTPQLQKVFFSDDGSTAMEVSLKLAYEFARRTGLAKRPRFLSLEGAYHGDTVGAVSLGHIDLFHKTWRNLLFKTDTVMAPYCYRCPFNRAQPERADARAYRRCNWECLDKMEQACGRRRRRGEPYAGFVFEPRMQGAAGMIPQPHGWLRRAAEIARSHGTLLVADEIMTAFGRVGQVSCLAPNSRTNRSQLNTRCNNRVRQDACPTLFASHLEGVQPDFLNLAKGLTGGYLPLAATLTTQSVFNAFLGRREEFKAFFHGHSYTGNQLGAAAGLASLELLQRPPSLRSRARLESGLRDGLKSLWELPQVGDIRQEGLVAGIELVRDWRTRQPFDLREQAGIRVCEAMARRGVLTRPIGNVIVLMPPYCTTAAQAKEMVQVLKDSIAKCLKP